MVKERMAKGTRNEGGCRSGIIRCWFWVPWEPLGGDDQECVREGAGWAGLQVFYTGNEID